MIVPMCDIKDRIAKWAEKFSQWQDKLSCQIKGMQANRGILVHTEEIGDESSSTAGYLLPCPSGSIPTMTPITMSAEMVHIRWIFSPAGSNRSNMMYQQQW